MKECVIAIGADHRGVAYKQFIKTHVCPADTWITWLDVGAHTLERSDYPVFAHEVVSAMQSGDAQAGILLCGTGIGMAIAANRATGIYAGVVWNEKIARLAKEDDNVNVLVLPCDLITQQEAIILIEVWRTATFKEGRYQERIDLIDA